MTVVTPIVLIGGGGHASDVLQAIEALNDRGGASYLVVGILDDAEVDPRRFVGRGVHQIGEVSDLDSIDAHWVVAAGWPEGRRTLVERIGAAGRPANAIVHPVADVGVGVQLGKGTVVLGGAHLSPFVRLGAHSLVSYGATVGHDTVFGDYASVMPNAAVSGDIIAGNDVLVGTGACVLQGLTLGDGAQIGAGAVVVKDVPADTTVVSLAARPRP
jgi:sugar O-acyltransferase (sialic acid O-acetyltransferase NeuD family)